MTASGGLQSDARRAVYEEDVVTYADDDTAEEWGDPQNYSATAVGLVSRVAGSDDEWSSDEEPEEVRTNDVGFRARFELVSRRDDNTAARSATRTKAPADCAWTRNLHAHLRRDDDLAPHRNLPHQKTRK